MRSMLQFRSDQFPSYGSEVEGVNWETVFGKRLAEYLQKKLPEHGFTVESIYAEDWGWELAIDNPEFGTFLGCRSVEGADQGGLTTFLVHLEPSKPLIKKLFKKIDTTATMNRIADALDAIIRSEPAITHAKWLGPDDEIG